MNISIWIVQGLLAVVTLMTGFLKVSQPKAKLKEMGAGRMDWVDSVSAGNLKLIGIVELLIGAGLLLPPLTGILPWLTPLAAVGLVCTMIGAMLLHLKRGDGMQAIATNIVLLVLAAFVAYGRFVLVPA